LSAQEHYLYEHVHGFFFLICFVDIHQAFFNVNCFRTFREHKMIKWNACLTFT